MVPLPGEANIENNEISTFVQVMKEKINVLWVSVNSRPGIILELVTSIQYLVPEALLVAQKADW